MIKLTYGQIRGDKFTPLVNQIVNSKMNVRTAKRVMDIVKEIQNEQKSSDGIFANLRDKWLEEIPESRGQLLRVKEGLTEEQKKEADKELEEFASIEVEIQKPRLTLDELANVQLSPQDLYILEGLVDGVES